MALVGHRYGRRGIVIMAAVVVTLAALVSFLSYGMIVAIGAAAAWFAAVSLFE